MKKESCLLCQIVDGKIPSYKIAENESAIAILDINGASQGHSFIIPKKHHPILEQVPDSEIGPLFELANKVSVSLFEKLGAEGTNIFVSNGVPAGQSVAHFLINVVPRKQSDGINLSWQPKKLSEEEMSTIELKVKEDLKGTSFDKKAVQQAPKSQPRHHPTPRVSDDEETFYALRRIP